MTSELKAMLGQELVKALDVVDDDANSMSLRVELVAEDVYDAGPAVRHIWTMAVLDGEVQSVSHSETLGGPGRSPGRTR
jgi:hypothetical protein